MKITKKLITDAAAVFAVCLAAGGCAKVPENIEEGILVKTAKVRTNQAGRLYFSGTVEAGKKIDLSFLTPGTVFAVDAREGDKVRKGQLLSKLDCQDNVNAYGIAQSKARQAEDAFRRFEPMYKNGNLPEIKMVEVETAKTDSELAVKLAKKHVDDCEISAPESGIISWRSLEPGETAVPGRAVMQLVTIDKIYASVSVPEKEIKNIKKGMKAYVGIPSGDGSSSGQDDYTGGDYSYYKESGKLMSGTVSDVGVTADPLARTYKVRILLDNPGHRILPDMICNVFFLNKGANAAGGAVVPGTAVRMDEEGNRYVFTVDDKNIAHKRIIDGIDFAEDGISVGGGVTVGETVVSEGVQKLSDGALVRSDN